MQNGFQFCPNVVLCFIIIKNVSSILPAGSIFFFLFFNLTQSLLLCILLFMSAEACRVVGDEVFSTNWCFLLNVSLWVGVTEGLAVR